MIVARDYARIEVAIWRDPDFRALTLPAQGLYLTLLTASSLNLCGVGDWRPKRLAAFSEGSTVDTIIGLAQELSDANFIIVDPDTEEVLVRSFIRHDQVLKSPNIAKGMRNQFPTIGSLDIMRAVADEVRRAVQEHPEWSGAGLMGPIIESHGGTNLEPDRNQIGTKSNQIETLSKGFHGVRTTTANSQQPTSLKIGTVSESAATLGVATASPSHTRRGHRLPDGWLPSDTDANRKLVAGKSATWVQGQLDKFGDYWRAISGQKGNKLDWDATWRNWVRNAIEYDGRKNNSARGPIDFDELNAQAEQWQAEIDAKGDSHGREASF